MLQWFYYVMAVSFLARHWQGRKQIGQPFDYITPIQSTDVSELFHNIMCRLQISFPQIVLILQ